ncbi:MAG: TetR family transcriptional regulator [Acidimicrobiales bacterium]|jgi:AcrR family transcriptional regulator
MNENREKDGTAGDVRPVGPERSAQVDALHQGLRERKKALMRQLISDTATVMFLERGFDEVRVSEIAAACDVSEKTIYNYFPTKESLLLDREEDSANAIRRALGPEGDPVSPVTAMVQILKGELEEFIGHINEHDQVQFSLIGDFNDLIESTPSLKAARADMIDRVAQVAAESMAARAGLDPNDPEPQIAADALTSLWRIFYRSIVKYTSGELSIDEVRAAVVSDVERAARLLDTGLWSFATMVQGQNGREQFNAAADASVEARKEVLAALKQARAAWHAVKIEMESHSHDDASVRRALNDVRAAHVQAHQISHQEAFEIRREARQRAQEVRDGARQRREEARKLGGQIKQEIKREIKEEARQRGQEIKDAVKRGRRPGRP